MQRLDDLSMAVPGLWPGEIVTNPKYGIALAQRPGYQSLTARLSAQMKALALQ